MKKGYNKDEASKICGSLQKKVDHSSSSEYNTVESDVHSSARLWFSQILGISEEQ